MTPYEIALKRIEECWQTRATKLDLRGLGLVELPIEVCELEWLDELDISSCQFSELSFLSYVPQLQALVCNVNQISDLSGLVHVPQLQSLYCHSNQLSDLSELVNVPQLRSLNCSENQLSNLSGLVYVRQLQYLLYESNQVSDLSDLVHVPELQVLICGANQLNDLSGLVHVPQLLSLDCGANQLSDLSGLVHVPQLQSLFCTNNQLSDLSDLVHVPQLQSLYCSSNQLSDLSDLVHVPQLQSLYCSSNQLSDLSDLVHVPQLQSLDCSSNQLSDLSDLVHVPQLQGFKCSSNQLSDLSALAYVPQLQSLDCCFNQLTEIPEVFSGVLNGKLKILWLYGNPVSGLPPILLGRHQYDNCIDALKNYLIDLKKGHQKQRQIKLQLVGNGRVGKTTLAYTLEHKQAPLEAFKSTHGITIKEIPLLLEGQDEPVTLQLWDFGGQEIYHATHRLFLSNDCLYLLLWAEETGECDEETRHPVSYWLESLHDLGPNSPIILVKNQIDRSDVLAARPDGLNRNVPGVSQIEAEVKVSAMRYRRMPSLRGEIESVLEKLAHKVCLNLPTAWVTVQQALKDLENQRTLPYARFRQLCIKAGVSDADWFVEYLHSSGLLFYKKGVFQDEIILDQNWVIEAVYVLFDPNKPFRASIEGSSGRFSGLLAKAFWEEVEEAEHEIYLSFMSNCSICYESGSKSVSSQPAKPLAERYFILPALLPNESSLKRAWGQQQKEDWILRVEYPFLHRSVIERLIIALGERWSGEPWRHGIYCDDTSFGQVLMEAHYANQNDSNQGYLGFSFRQHARDEAVYALRELVRVSSPHSRYKEYLQKGSDAEVSLPEFERRENRSADVKVAAKTVSLFISYSHKDEKLYKDELVKCLKGIKRKLPLNYWDDRKMLPGDMVNCTILDFLEAADIVVLLISRDFFASDYCFNIEMEAALKRYEDKKNVVIPIIVRSTADWHDFDIGKITALPTDGKPLSKWNDKDEFWEDVQTGIRRQVENLLGVK